MQQKYIENMGSRRATTGIDSNTVTIPLSSPGLFKMFTMVVSLVLLLGRRGMPLPLSYTHPATRQDMEITVSDP